MDNPLDSPLIVNASSNEYYKQPMFYVIGHFSKFLKPDSVRLDFTLKGATKKIYVTVFQDPKGHVIVILLNKNNKPISVKIINAFRESIDYEVSAKSITTFYGKK